MIATVCCFAVIVLLIPHIAQGEETDATSSPETVPQALLDVREQVQEANQTALEEAPLAKGQGCGQTLDVQGIGETCRTKDGLLRIELEDGRSSTIHGMDAPPLSANGFAPTSTVRVGTASVNDIRCATSNELHYTLIYAKPKNVASRYTEVAPAFKQAAYQMSAYVDSESQSVDPSVGLRLPILCEAGEPVVKEVEVGEISAAGIDFVPLVQQLANAGLSYNVVGGSERYIVFLDAVSSIGAAGTGHVFTNDSRASTDNANNRGGMFAVQYRHAQLGALPRWDVLMHEVSHTMGAVSNNAPHASGAGHCNDGEDIMCYMDGANSGAYAANACTVKVLDCNRDDYFNPSPQAGSYLAKNWNMAGPANLWLERRDSADQIPPTIPSALRVTGASNTALGVSWNASIDNVGVVAYKVSVSGSPEISTTRLSAAATGLSASTQYSISVVAVDARGNRSDPATLLASTTDKPDTNAPKAPSRVSYKFEKGKLIISWSEALDDVGVDSYQVRRVNLRKVRGRQIRSVKPVGKPIRDTKIVVPAKGMKKGVVYPFEVVARDSAGNVSVGKTVNVRVAVDRIKPTAPGNLRVVSVRGGSATLTWIPSTDSSGIKKYVVFQQIKGGWRPLASISGGSSKLVLRNISNKGLIVVRLGAYDPSGNVSLSRPVKVRSQ